MTSESLLLTGRAERPPTPRPLRAGRLSVLLDGPDLRSVRLGDVELVQRVYVAVRDAPWNTIPAEYSDWEIDAREDRFRVAFRARHRHGSIDFEWSGTIEGTPAGVITYEMDGVCHGEFEYSKIGFNVHHGLERSVGRRFRAQTEDGELRGILPEEIDPQRIVDGKLSGMFAPYRELAIEVADGLEAVVALEGDLLELQDHRNWTDANFKSYGTPLALGFPFDAHDGDRIRQVLTIGSRGEAPPSSAPGPVTITIGERIGPLPAIGFGQPSHGRPLSAREADALRLLAPAHLRVDVQLADEAFRVALEAAAADAIAIGSALELAVFANEASGPQLDRLGAALRELTVPIARVLVYFATDGFSAMLGLTPAAVVRLVRERLEPVTGSVVFAGGTNQNFSDINRDRPTDPVLTGICYSISPTVHGADDTSIVENLAGQAEVIGMTKRFAGDRAICISPVTLATRFGPYPSGPSAPDDLPAAVDVRQASLLGAAWTAASVGQLARAGAASATYYETTGWRGVIETDDGPPDRRFPSEPGIVFPMYHVFADVAEWREGSVLRAESSAPLAVQALAVRDTAGTHLLLANVSPDAVSVVVDGLPGGEAAARTLDTTTARSAMSDPLGFRAAAPVPLPRSGGALRLDLAPYAVLRLDATAAARDGR